MQELNQAQDELHAREALAEAWSSVLNSPAPEAGDDFFDEADSIAALRLIARLRERGFTLRLDELHQDSEFEAVAARLTRTAEVVSGPRGVRRLPLLPVQARTLEYDRIDPSYHNDDNVYAVPPGATVDELIGALDALVVHHPSLGTRFRLTPGEECQEIGHEVDVRATTEVVEVEPGDAERVERIGTAAHRGLDLETGRVLAVRILTWRDEPWALAIVVHHLVCDLMSWNIIASDLARLIEAKRTGSSPELPAATDVGAWIDFLTEQAAGTAYRPHLAYWRSRPWSEVTGVRRLTTDADRRLGDLHKTRSSVDLGDAEAFRRAAATYGSDVIVVGALNYALRHVYQASTTVIDMVVNGRDQIPSAPDVSRTVGYLAEFAPVVTELGDAQDPVAVIRATAEQFRATPAPRIAFGVLRHFSPDPSIRRELRQVPAADLYVNYRGSLRSSHDSALPELPYSLGPFQSPDEQQGYPVRIMVDLDGATMNSVWKYSPTELAESDVEMMIEAFNRALSELTKYVGSLTGTGRDG